MPRSSQVRPLIDRTRRADPRNRAIAAAASIRRPLVMVVAVPRAAIVRHDGLDPDAVAGMRLDVDRVEDALHAIDRVAAEQRRNAAPRRRREQLRLAFDELPRHRHVRIDGARHVEARGAHEARRRQRRAPARAVRQAPAQRRRRSTQRPNGSADQSGARTTKRAAPRVAPPDGQELHAEPTSV